MRRLRRTVDHGLRLAGPCSILTAAVWVAGLGLHAARDWHRHGEIGAGFFHLHFHVGDHEHQHHDDQHPVNGDHDHDTPGDDQRKRTAVLTVANALYDLSSDAPTIVDPENALGERTIECIQLPRTIDLSAAAKPRAPPA